MASSDLYDLRDRLRRAADLLVRHRFQGWFYGDSVGFEGLIAASDLLGYDRWEGFAHGFLRGWATRAVPYREIDNTVAGRALCLLAERHGDELLLETGRELAHYLCTRPVIGDGAFVSFARAPLREPYGGEPLPPDEAELMGEPGPGVYVDCLHFDPPFLVHLGALLGDPEMVDTGARQALAYVSMLQDADSGLFHHFWLARTARPYVLGWARGQGWALLGLLDVLERLPREHVAWPRLADAMRSLSAAMVRTQCPDGSWWAVAQVPASGPESSTAAFMAAGLRGAVERGWLEREPGLEAAERAWAATRAALGSDGALTGVSAAVWSSTRESHYHHVPRGLVVPWGQGPLLLAAAAWLGTGGASRATTSA